ncbi:MAG TPA: GAF domain-containing protein [Rhizomicrobium sp.]|nr:GAF domain-containing protein [Rhizomicrobium sp.]
MFVSAFDASFESRRKLLAVARERFAYAETLEDIVALVRSTARAIFSADGVTFVLRDGGKCHYVDEDAIGPLWKGQKFPMESCISGWCMLNGKTAAIEDIFADPRIPHDVYRRTFVKSLIMAPVGRETPVAAIGAYWSERRLFVQKEIGMVEALAGVVAEAMEQAQGPDGVMGKLPSLCLRRG